MRSFKESEVSSATLSDERRNIVYKKPLRLRVANNVDINLAVPKLNERKELWACGVEIHRKHGAPHNLA